MRFRLLKLVFGAALLMAGCVSLSPEESVVGDYLSGRLAAKSNDINSAAKAFSDAYTEAPGSVDILRDAFFYQMAAGNIGQAVVFAERLSARESSDDGLSSLVLAAQAVKSGNYSAAQRYMNDDKIAAYLTPTSNIIRAWAVAGESGAAAALTSLRDHAGEEYKGFYPLHQGFLSEQAGELDEARNAFQIAMMTLGGPVEVSAYGMFLERTGDDAAAREFYEPIADSQGFGSIPARSGLKRLDHEDEKISFSGMTPQKGAALAYFSLANGILQQAVSQRAAAERAGFRVPDANYNMPLGLTQLAIYLDPAFDEARRFTGTIFNYYGDYEKAISVLSGVDAGSPYYESTRIEIATSLNALERGEEAAEVLKRLVRDNDNALDARLALAGYYAAKNQHGETVTVLSELINKLPAEPNSDAWRYYLTRGASLLELDRWPEAEADLKRAAEIAPEESTVLNYLGYTWAERGENLEEAFALIEKAVALEPNSGPIIDSLGWAHFQLGAYDEAVGHLEQAASLESGDATITDHLGDVYWRLGRKVEAKFQWRRVLELDPDEKLKISVKEKLQSGLPDTDE